MVKIYADPLEIFADPNQWKTVNLRARMISICVISEFGKEYALSKYLWN